MTDLASRSLLSRALSLIHRLRTDARGVAGIEFAFVLPLMFFLFVGAVELSQAITVDRRVTLAASSVADLVAREEKKISQTEIADIMKIGGYVMAPYNATALQVTVRNVSASPSDASKTKVSWQCTYAPGATTPQCECKNETYPIPSGLVTKNDSVVVVDADYTYTPLVFDYFLSKNMAPGAGGPGTYTLSERIFMKPRGQAAKLKQQNGEECPTPTY